MRTDYACSGSEDEVTKRVSCEGLLPRLDKGYPSEDDSRDGTRDEALARTQVYLSKTKLKLEI